MCFYDTGTFIADRAFSEFPLVYVQFVQFFKCFTSLPPPISFCLHNLAPQWPPGNADGFHQKQLKAQKSVLGCADTKGLFLYANCWGTFVASGAGWKCLNFWYFFGFDFFPKFFGPTGYKNEAAYTKPMQWIKVHTHVCREWYAHQVDLGMRSFMMWYFYVCNAS